MRREHSYMGYLCLLVIFYQQVVFAGGGTASREFPWVPREQLTTGTMCRAQEDDFSEYRYEEDVAVCLRRVSAGLKRKVFEAYGVSPKCYHEYTIDHFIPLALGGNNSINNLWPEHKAIKRLRYNLEMELYQGLLKGTITHKAALAKIRAAKLNPPSPGGREDSIHFCL